MSFKLKKQRPIGTQAFRVRSNFKTRTPESKHRGIARSLPTQAHLDYFLSKFKEAERPMVLELLRPHLEWLRPVHAEDCLGCFYCDPTGLTFQGDDLLPPAQAEETVPDVGGPEAFCPVESSVPANETGGAQERTPEAN